ncbi:hypothetical protein XAC2852_130035 [Xanthomonas citri pv. citri]|nr:hypothetical protein XAC2852_130035 [Xanthomonas citri pv. citri]
MLIVVFGSGFAALLANEIFLARIFDRGTDGAYIGAAGVEFEAPGERAVRAQFALFEQRPHLFAVMGVQQLGRETAKAIAQVVHVAQQHVARGIVAGGADHLRKVDHYRAIGRNQHVVFGQIAVHQAQRQHLDHIADQAGMEGARLIGLQFHFAQPRCAVTGVIGDQIHQQHAVEVTARFGHMHAGIHQLIERIGFGVLPGGLSFLAAELGGLAHRARLTAATHLAAFLVLHARLETALRHVLVDLGAQDLGACAHHVDGCFLAALQWSQHFVDDAVVDQRLQAVGGFHGLRAPIRHKPAAIMRQAG